MRALIVGTSEVRARRTTSPFRWGTPLTAGEYLLAQRIF
jgi:hypothetical protein